MGAADEILDRKGQEIVMYKLEEKKRAVELYIKSGKKVGPVLHALGYPSPNRLRDWYKELCETGVLHGDVRSKFTTEQRERALEYWRTHDYNIRATINALGYPGYTTLTEWIEKYVGDDERADCILKRGVVNYTIETKQAAVIQSIAGEDPDYIIAARGGFSVTSLQKWKRQLTKGDMNIEMPKRKREDLPNDLEALQTEIAEMKERLYQMQIEYDVLQKAAEIIKKGQRVNPEEMTNAEKAEMIDALKGKYPLKALLQSTGMSKSSYFYQRRARSLPDKYIALRAKIKEAFIDNRSCYGYRRIYAVLKNKGIRLSEKIVRRIMKEEHLLAGSTPPKKYCSYAGEISPAVENLVARDFHAEAPNKKWLTDITEFSIPAGKVYLSPMIDCFDGMPVSWTIGTSPNANLVNTMLDMAIGTLGAEDHPIVHSDRGCHYRWPGWIDRMNEAGLTRSMSRKGCSPDNSACEGFFGRIKNEMFYGKSWAETTVKEFIEILDSYLHWYSEERIKESLGWRSPLQYRIMLGLIT